MPAIPMRTRVLIVGAVAACAALAAAEPARGGPYTAAICDFDLGAWRADASFARSSRHYVSAAECGAHGDGLSVSHDATPAAAGSWGAWTVRAPAGTAIRRVGVTAAGRAGDGETPELFTGPVEDPLATFGHPGGKLRRFAWSGLPVRTFAASLRCRHAAGCAPGHGSSIRVKRIGLRLSDGVPPRIDLAGSLLDSGSRRGLQTIAPSASDVGGGVRRFLVQVNGEPVTAHTTPCQLAGRTAIRLRPCPRAASASFVAATTSSPFQQGRNAVRVCAADYAATTAANRTCAERRVRVDNLCPISEVTGGASLRAHLHRARRSGTVTGRLLDRGGSGVGGATVCIATRVHTDAAIETVLATPATDDAGRFSAAIPKGPSRELRIAYWPNDDAALERRLELHVHAHPRLTTSPDRPVRNGNRARFQVHLPAPENARRRVLVQARAGHRWLDLRSGLTDARGVYSARYRFHDTTGRRRYAFRALVPKQAGYPYEAGRSEIRHVTVLGR